MYESVLLTWIGKIKRLSQFLSKYSVLRNSNIDIYV